MMPRSPLHQIGDILGMYAYLAAMGGLRYWPALREGGVIEERLPAPASQNASRGIAYEYEHDPGRERTPAI